VTHRGGKKNFLRIGKIDMQPIFFVEEQEEKEQNSASKRK
jgi:hypothetical protein